MDKKYPRLVVYKQAGRCEHDKVDLPWRVGYSIHPGYSTTEFRSESVKSCWEHVAYKLNPKKPGRRLVKTLNKH